MSDELEAAERRAIARGWLLMELRRRWLYAQRRRRFAAWWWSARLSAPKRTQS